MDTPGSRVKILRGTAKKVEEIRYLRKEDTLKRGHQAAYGVGGKVAAMGSRRSLPGVDRVCFSSGFIMAQSFVLDSCAEEAASMGGGWKCVPHLPWAYHTRAHHGCALL